jgi:LysR family transcriptional regulator (chromosome initiation inhibitor)
MRLPADLVTTLAVAIDEGTLEAAARVLHVTPSAVSQRVRALEERVGRTLLVRTRPLRVTEAGEAVVRLARQLALLEHDTLRALGSDEAGTARVALAINADSLATWFLPALARLVEGGDVTVELLRDDQDYTARLLADGSVSAAVTSQSTAVAGCTVTALGVMSYRAYATPTFVDRWFGDGVDATSLAVAPVIEYDRRDDLQSRWLRDRGAAPAAPPRTYVPASHDFASAVRMGLGWGMLPPMQADAALAQGQIVELPGERIPVPLYWQQWDLRSAVLDRVARVVIDEARRVLDRS